MQSLPVSLTRDLETVQAIPGIPAMLELLCRVTGMGFSAVARVTSEHWLACRVRDEINFGLTEGGELKVETTICNWIRDHKVPVVFDDIENEEHEIYRSVAAMYGFSSYISYPITLNNGSFFGTICAIDPKPQKITNERVHALFVLFVKWVTFSLERVPMDDAFRTEAKNTLARLSDLESVSSNSKVQELILQLQDRLAD